MELSFRKLWTVMGVAALSANLTAAPASSNSSTSTQSSNDNSMVASGIMYAGPMLSEDATGITLGADYILWQVGQEGLETAGNYYSTTAFPTEQGVNYFPQFGMRSGFKVHGQVTISECDDVDLFVEYIWLQRSTDTNSGVLPSYTADANLFSSSDYTHLIYPTDINSSFYPSSYSSSFKFNYNVLDFEIGRLSSIAKDSFSLRPFFGIRGVWNSSTWTPSVTFNDDSDPVLTATATTVSYQNTSGAGVRAGFDMAWQFYANSDYFGGLKILGSTALSGVYGRTYVTTTSDWTGQMTIPVDHVYSNNKSSLNRTVPIIDLSVGLGWDMSFGGERDNDYNVEIHALWDTQTWINYGKSQIQDPNYVIRPQNLYIQGLTVGASLGF